MKQGTTVLNYFTMTDTFCHNKCKCIIAVIIFSITYSKLSLCIKPCTAANSPQGIVFVLCAWQTTEIIYLWLYSPLLDPGCFFSFLILYTVGRTPWKGDQPIAMPLPTHRTTEIQNKCTQISMPWVGFEPTISMFNPAKTVHALDRAATEVSTEIIH
jgi:hypothetical protein